MSVPSLGDVGFRPKAEVSSSFIAESGCISMGSLAAVGMTLGQKVTCLPGENWERAHEQDRVVVTLVGTHSVYSRALDIGYGGRPQKLLGSVPGSSMGAPYS